MPKKPRDEMPHDKTPHDKLPHPGLDGVDAASSQVFQSFRNLMVLNRRLMQKLLAEKGFHPAQAGCLRVLAHHDGISQSDLARHLGVSKPTVTTMLQKMQKAGLITREADERDQRVTRTHLTPAGRKMLKELSAVFAELIEVSIGALPEPDRRELDRIFGEMGTNITRALEQPC